MKTKRKAKKSEVFPSGESFVRRKTFPPDELPTKRQVLERITDFWNFRTADAATDVAKEIYDRWVWCNVYSLHCLNVASKLQSLVACFSKLDRWPKQKRCAESFFQKEAKFLTSMNCSTLFAATVISKNIWKKSINCE